MNQADYTKLAAEWSSVAGKMESVGAKGSLSDYLRTMKVCDSKDKAGVGYKHYLRFVTKHTAALKAGVGREAEYARSQQALYEGKQAARQAADSPNARVRTKVVGVAEDGLTMMEAGEVAVPRIKGATSAGIYKRAIEAAIAKLDGLKGGAAANIKTAIAEALEGLRAAIAPPPEPAAITITPAEELDEEASEASSVQADE